MVGASLSGDSTPPESRPSVHSPPTFHKMVPMKLDHTEDDRAAELQALRRRLLALVVKSEQQRRRYDQRQPDASSAPTPAPEARERGVRLAGRRQSTTRAKKLEPANMK